MPGNVIVLRDVSEVLVAALDFQYGFKEATLIQMKKFSSAKRILYLDVYYHRVSKYYKTRFQLILSVANHYVSFGQKNLEVFGSDLAVLAETLS